MSGLAKTLVVGTWVVVFFWNEFIIFSDGGAGWGVASLLLTPTPPITSLLIGIFLGEWLPLAIIGAVTVVGLPIMVAGSDDNY